MFNIEKFSKYKEFEAVIPQLAGENLITFAVTPQTLDNFIVSVLQGRISGADELLSFKERAEAHLSLEYMASLVTSWKGDVFGGLPCTLENVTEFLTQLKEKNPPSYLILQQSVVFYMEHINPQLEDVATVAKKPSKQGKSSSTMTQ